MLARTRRTWQVLADMPMRRTVPPDRHYGEAMYARGKTVRACRKPRAGMPDGWLARSGGRLAGMPRGAGLRPTAATCRNGYRTTHLECPRSDDRPVDTGAGGSVRFAGIEHRSHSVSRTGKLTEFRYHRIVAAPSHAVCAGAAKPDHPQLCVTSGPGAAGFAVAPARIPAAGSDLPGISGLAGIENLAPSARTRATPGQ